MTEEQNFLVLINNYRAASNLKTLVIDQYLQNASQWMTDDMLTKQCCIVSTSCTPCGHTDSQGRDMATRLLSFGYPAGTTASAGENLAWGLSGSIQTAQQAFDTWKNSPGHNANMLDSSWTVIGISRSCDSSINCTWATDFGSQLVSSTCTSVASNLSVR